MSSMKLTGELRHSGMGVSIAAGTTRITKARSTTFKLYTKAKIIPYSIPAMI
jgi:hypothetical protein